MVLTMTTSKLPLTLTHFTKPHFENLEFKHFLGHINQHLSTFRYMEVDIDRGLLSLSQIPMQYANIKKRLITE